MTAGGRELRWQRDPVNVYAFHVDVPAGVAQVEVDFQYLSALQATDAAGNLTRRFFRYLVACALPSTAWHSALAVVHATISGRIAV